MQKIIDAKGATLSPGFSDIHAHITLNTGPADMFYAPVDYHAALTLYQAEKTLMMGFYNNKRRWRSRFWS
jgi:imidazolonepropionase-like amidohydrolase